MGMVRGMVFGGVRARRAGSRQGFTMIELMIVIAIIGILVGMLMVALAKAKDSATRAKAKVQVKQLEKAFVAYHDEYGKWPMGMTSYDSDPKESNLTGIELEEKCALMLAGKATDVNGVIYNAQEIPFLPHVEIKMSNDSKRGYLDPWGYCYKYMMDFNDDGELYIQFSNASGSGDKSITLDGPEVGVWSRGPDGTDALGGDDVTSWASQ